MACLGRHRLNGGQQWLYGVPIAACNLPMRHSKLAVSASTWIQQRQPKHPSQAPAQASHISRPVKAHDIKLSHEVAGGRVPPADQTQSPLLTSAARHWAVSKPAASQSRHQSKLLDICRPVKGHAPRCHMRSLVAACTLLIQTQFPLLTSAARRWAFRRPAASACSIPLQAPVKLLGISSP